MLYKGTTFDAQEINKGKRIAIIKFATYGSLDRDGDMSNKGMFTKSWNESIQDVRVFVNHDPKLAPGRLQGFDDGRSPLWDDEKGAYARIYLGTHTLGEDTLKMMDEGIITNNSFGFDPVKSAPIKDKGKSFKEAKHHEVSVLTHWGAHPDSLVQDVYKARVNKEELTEEESDEVQKEIEELELQIKAMESFCRNTKASDITIKEILLEIEEKKSAIELLNNTAVTSQRTKPDASVNKEFADALRLSLLTLKF